MDAATVVEVFDPGGDSGVDLVAGGEGTPGHVQVFQMDGVGISIIGRPEGVGSFVYEVQSSITKESAQQ